MMLNNDVLRRLRYVLDINDAKMMDIFAGGGHAVTREQVTSWLKKDDEPAFVQCEDLPMIAFLDGLIIDRRGPSDAASSTKEMVVNNNLIFRKLKIAFNLQAEDILAIFDLSGFALGKHELSAFFRRPLHKNYRECQDQILRNFLNGLQLKYRPT